jgi:hypothetical protein
LGNLSERYESLLRTNKLLPNLDADDLPEVIERLKKIDPQHSLLTDSRLDPIGGAPLNAYYGISPLRSN